MQTVYDQDFLDASAPRPLALYNGSQIYQVMPHRTTGGEHFAAAGGDWWYDGNHTPPGPGWLALLCVLYHVTKTDPINRPGVVNANDLRGGQITFRCRAIGSAAWPHGFYLPQTTRLGLWLQTFDKAACNGQGGHVNYFNTRHLICEKLGVPRPQARNFQDYNCKPPGWVDCTIPLTTDPGDWINLAPNPRMVNFYGQTSIERALASWNHNIGIVALLGESLPAPPNYPYPLGYAGGEFHIDRIKLETA